MNRRLLYLISELFSKRVSVIGFLIFLSFNVLKRMIDLFETQLFFFHIRRNAYMYGYTCLKNKKPTFDDSSNKIVSDNNRSL